MNKFLFICMLLALGSSAQAQSIKASEVPQIVVSAFKKDYPNATGIKWEMSDGMYEASFQNAKKEISTIYSYQGFLALTETTIEVAALPAGVMEYISKNMASTTISEATKIVDVQGIVSYKAEVNHVDYLFTANGQFLLRKADEDAND